MTVLGFVGSVSAWPVVVSLAGVLAMISMLSMFFGQHLSKILKWGATVFVGTLFGYLSGIISYVMLVSPAKYPLHQTIAAVTGCYGVTVVIGYWILRGNFNWSRPRAFLGGLFLLGLGLLLVVWLHA